MGVDHHIVIGVGDDFVPRLRGSSVPRPIQAGAWLHHIPESRKMLDYLARGVVHWGVIHNQDFEPVGRIVQLLQRAQGPLQTSGSAASTYGNGDTRERLVTRGIGFLCTPLQRMFQGSALQLPVQLPFNFEPQEIRSKKALGAGRDPDQADGTPMPPDQDPQLRVLPRVHFVERGQWLSQFDLQHLGSHTNFFVLSDHSWFVR